MLASNEILDWINDMREASSLCCEEITLKELNKWNVNKNNMRHDTNRFFSVIGVRANNTVTGELIGEQPIISQPEIGILGFILQNKNHKIQILLQAKTEPGNIGGTQIAPTVQATQSNYMCVHGGVETKFIENFIKHDMPIFEGVLQSEQGTRFLGKYNRNVTIFLNADENLKNVDGNWRWFDLEDLFKIIDYDFCINTDARSVLASSDWNYFNLDLKPFERGIGFDEFGEKLHISYHSTEGEALYTTHEIIDSLELHRSDNKFSIKEINIEDLSEWNLEDNGLLNKAQFSVKAFKVKVKGREVPSWSQPLVSTDVIGIVILYCKIINGVLHFLIKYSQEIGFFEYFQLGPSVQYMNNDGNSFPYEFNEDEVSEISSCTQSDEGGRFYHCNVEYSLIEINQDISMDMPHEYSWVTLQQIRVLLSMKGIFTNEFRSALSLIFKYI